VDLFHVLYCSVRIEVLALASLFSGERLVVTCCDCFSKRVSVNIGCCGVLWFSSSLVCSVASDIKLVYLYSTIKMMHGPINIRYKYGVWDRAWNP